MNLADQIEALDAKATAGPWETDSTDNGGSGSERFNYYSVGAGPAGKWETIVDTLNSDVAEIHEEWDGDEHGVYHHAWDDQGRANCELIVALRNAVPEILAALRLAETSSITALSDGAPSALADRVETSATPSDVAELVERLRAIHVWPEFVADEAVGNVAREAAATLTAQAQRIAELEAELVGCDLIPEGDHAKLLSRNAELEAENARQRDAVQHYEAALLAAKPHGARGVIYDEWNAARTASWNTRTPPASQSDEALVIPGQIPPFLSAPTFDDRAEQRVCINGCLYLRADFAGERHASAHAAGRREGIEEAAKVADAGTGLAHVSEAHAMASARARSIAQNIRALAKKQP